MVMENIITKPSIKKYINEIKEVLKEFHLGDVPIMTTPMRGAVAFIRTKTSIKASFIDVEIKGLFINLDAFDRITNKEDRDKIIRHECIHYLVEKELIDKIKRLGGDISTKISVYKQLIKSFYYKSHGELFKILSDKYNAFSKGGCKIENGELKR